MNKRISTLIFGIGAVAVCGQQAAAQETPSHILDWNAIEHWTGSGSNRAALIVQFDEDPYEEAYVWGYRWDTPENETDPESGMPTVSGETMFRAVAEASLDLDLFTQYTGSMGSTVCGIGYSYRHEVMDYVEFDFEGAQNDNKNNFNYWVAGGAQTSAPGGSTPDICQAAIETARTTHILDHPVNARIYGCPAYDYDHWGSADLSQNAYDNVLWQSGWYDGYWAFLTGGENLRRLAYSGVGMSSMPLTNNSVHAWVYHPLDRDDAGDVMADSGTIKVSNPLNYEHWELPVIPDTPSGTAEIESADYERMEIYTLQGVKVGDNKTDLAELTPGVYIMKRGTKTYKIKY